MAVSGKAASAYMYAGRPNEVNACLYTCWLAYGSPHSLGKLAGHTFATAAEAAAYTTKRHYDRRPPEGAAVWFGATSGPRYSGDTTWRAGDVTVARKNYRLGATDYPSFGHIGECTIAEREAQTGREYLFWSEDFLGNPITLVTPAATGAHPITNEPTEPQEDEDDMAKNSGFYYTRERDGAIVYLIANTDSGFVSEYTDGSKGKAIPASYNNRVAIAYGTGTFAIITEGHAIAIKRDAALVRAAKQ